MRNIRYCAIILLLTLATPLAAQCPIKNTAFSEGEKLSYQLYFNWQFIWLKAGTAEMQITSDTFQNQAVYRSHLITRGNKRTDRHFMMRDTLLSFTRKTDLAPLYYRKGALEGKRYNVDEVWYSYPAPGKMTLRQRFQNYKGEVREKQHTTTECIFDMMSMLLRARSFDPSAYKKGQRIHFLMADGDNIDDEILIFRGRKRFKLDETNETFNCLVFSFIERNGKKEKEIVTFYVTDDLNHLPVRLDLYLRFGTAKAYLNHYEGLRNPATSVIR